MNGPGPIVLLQQPVTEKKGLKNGLQVDIPVMQWIVMVGLSCRLVTRKTLWIDGLVEW